jgi:hypothetical protein
MKAFVLSVIKFLLKAHLPHYSSLYTGSCLMNLQTLKKEDYIGLHRVNRHKSYVCSGDGNHLPCPSSLPAELKFCS